MAGSVVTKLRTPVRPRRTSKVAICKAQAERGATSVIVRSKRGWVYDDTATHQFWRDVLVDVTRTASVINKRLGPPRSCCWVAGQPSWRADWSSSRVQHTGATSCIRSQLRTPLCLPKPPIGRVSGHASQLHDYPRAAHGRAARARAQAKWQRTSCHFPAFAQAHLQPFLQSTKQFTDASKGWRIVGEKGLVRTASSSGRAASHPALGHSAFRQLFGIFRVRLLS